MENNLHLSACIIALLCCVLPAQAQVKDEIQRYQQAAGDRSILFRGEQATVYAFPANGNPYWDNDEFWPGDIVFEGNLYRDVLINVDARAQRALVRLSSGPFSVALAPGLVSSFNMGWRHFEGFGPGEALPEGFYEVFGEGPEKVYKHVTKSLAFNLNHANGDLIGYDDPNYRSNVYRYFAISRPYYFRDAEGRFSRIKGRNALLRKFPERRKELRRALDEAQLGPKEFDASCVLVLKLTAR